MNSRFIGGILLIVGTSIGAGMLALPVANAALGFWNSTLLLFFCWLVMTLGAFFILEVNLYLPKNNNMVSMAYATLGQSGLIVVWLCYLLLLYTLIAAYISGGTDVFMGLLHQIKLIPKEWAVSVLFTAVFGMVVYAGITKVDFLNRLLMFFKLAIYLFLILFVAPYINLPKLGAGSHSFTYYTQAVMILITSFGFAIIVPNLRTYFNDDVKKLRQVILIGSIIPLICYIAWDAIIIGSIPRNTLTKLFSDPHPTSALAIAISHQIQNTFINGAFDLFTSICMLTAFIGVSLCLISFLADGLKMEVKGKQGLVLFLLTFIPPLILVLYIPGAYLYALNYAGFLCVILLLFMPVLMSFFGRKRFNSPYYVPGGKLTQISLMLASIILIGIACCKS